MRRSVVLQMTHLRVFCTTCAMPPLRRLRRLKGSGSDLFCATLLCSPLVVSCRWELSDHPRFVITPIDVCVLARSHYRGIYATHGDTTAPHTDWPFDAAEGSTALSSARLFFMRGFVMLAYSAGPFVSVNSFFVLCPGFGFYYWVRGARFGITTAIGLLEEF